MIIKMGTDLNSAISAGAEIHLSSVFPEDGKMQMLRKRQGTVLCLLAENEETENRPLSLPENRPLLENVFSGEPSLVISLAKFI